MSSLSLCFPHFQPLKLCFPPLSAPLLICRGSMSPQVWEGFRDTFGPQSDKTADITQGEKPQYLTKKAWQFIFPPNCAARLWSLHWPRNKWKSFDILCWSQFEQIFSISVKQFVFTSTLLTQIWEKHSRSLLCLELDKETTSFVFFGQKAEILRPRQTEGFVVVTLGHTELSSGASSQRSLPLLKLLSEDSSPLFGQRCF